MGAFPQRTSAKSESAAAGSGLLCCPSECRQELRLSWDPRAFAQGGIGAVPCFALPLLALGPCWADAAGSSTELCSWEARGTGSLSLPQKCFFQISSLYHISVTSALLLRTALFPLHPFVEGALAAPCGFGPIRLLGLGRLVTVGKKTEISCSLFGLDFVSVVSVFWGFLPPPPCNFGRLFGNPGLTWLPAASVGWGSCS